MIYQDSTRVVQNMLVEKEEPTDIIQLRAIIPNVSGNVYAKIADHMNNEFVAVFNAPDLSQVHDIDFTGIVPPGFFIENREFLLTLHQPLQSAPLTIDLRMSFSGVYVVCTDDTNGTGEDQAIGLLFPTLGGE
jgi:hypothetical protein